MTEITVLQAVLSDLNEAAHLFDEYRQFQGQAADVPGARDFLRARFDHGESAIFIALDAAEPVGFAQLYPLFSSVSLSRAFILNDLFVRPTCRRRGVASALLIAIENHAWTLGSTRITLNVARGNTSAQEFYRARGWCQDEQFLMFQRERRSP